MKKIVRQIIAIGSVSVSVSAAPFLAIGDNAELLTTGQASVAYNDNILLGTSTNELADTIFTFIPGLNLRYGRDATVSGNVFLNSTLTSYADNDNLNNQLLGVGATAAYDNGRLQMSVNASFTELDQATVDNAAATGNTGRLLEHHVVAFGFDGEYRLSEKFSFGSGFSYNKTDYKTANITEQEEYTVPANVYYELTPKVDLSSGITYKHTELTVSGANKYDAYYFNIGARGDFTAKLSGNASVGYNRREADVGQSNEDGLGAKTSLVYTYSDKTRFTLNLDRDFNNATSGGSSYENTEVRLGASSALTVDWSVNTALTYRVFDYTNRTEDYYQFDIGATHVINARLSTSLSYIYRELSSNSLLAREFNNNLVTLSIVARY